MTRIVLIGMLLLGLIGLSGCELGQPAPDKAFFTLDATSPVEAPSPTATPGPLLTVPRARIAPPFGRRALQYRVAERRFEPDYYNNWADDPGALVAAAARDTFAASGVFTVLPDGSNADGAVAVQLEVASLYIDVTGAAPAAVLSMRVTVVDQSGRVRLTRQFDRTESLSSAAGTAATRGLSDALHAVLDQLITEIADAIG